LRCGEDQLQKTRGLHGLEVLVMIAIIVVPALFMLYPSLFFSDDLFPFVGAVAGPSLICGIVYYVVTETRPTCTSCNWRAWRPGAKQSNADRKGK
jgi:hypothetical protein